jgi:CysZ protein
LALKFNSFVRGFTTPVRALQAIFENPRLIFLSLFPILMTLVVAAICIYAILTGAFSLGTAWFQSIAGTYAGVASGIFAFIVGIFSFYLMFHTIGILLSLLSSPFNDWLSEETERSVGRKVTPLNFWILIRVFFLDLLKTAATLSFSVVLWIMALIPGLGLIAPLGFALITTLTFISYPQSRRNFGLIECFIWVKRNLAASLGFGLATMLMFGIPVVNVFALPLAVVGGTLLFIDCEKSALK